MKPIALLTIGQVAVHAHQVLVGVGILLSLALASIVARKAALPKRSYFMFAPLAVLLGFMFAHFFYCMASFEQVLYDLPPGTFFHFWDGRYMLYGGMVGCVLAAWVAAKLTHCSALRMLDAIAPAGIMMIVFVRVAQGLQGNGYGDYLEEGSPFARFPFAVFDAYYMEWTWALFIIAALYAVILLFLLLTRKGKFPGDLALFLIGLYAAGQIILESLRRDDFLRWGFVRCSQVASTALVIFTLFCYALRVRKQRTTGKALCWIVCIAMLTLCLLLEFAVEGRIAFLLFLTPQGCYVAMACACLVLIGCICWMRALSQDSAQKISHRS